MDGRLIVLNKVVEALGEDGSIGSFEDRKRLQKAIYLSQVAGVDLGYRYGWYIKGPYSTDLTRDYYSMAEAIADGSEIPAKHLKEEIKEKLVAIKRLFRVPADTALNKADWMELLASWHYLRKVSRYDDAKAREIMKERKANLVEHIPLAKQKLSAFGLL